MHKKEMSCALTSLFHYCLSKSPWLFYSLCFIKHTWKTVGSILLNFTLNLQNNLEKIDVLTMLKLLSTKDYVIPFKIFLKSFVVSKEDIWHIFYCIYI